jgi:hypothetical protein
MTDITIFNAELSAKKYITSPFSCVIFSPILPFSMQNFLHQGILAQLLIVSDYDWYYHFQCRTLYTKVYYLSFKLYHIITYTIIFNAGLDAKDLALHPEDKHLFRLAQLIKVDEFNSLVIKLRLSQTIWDDYQHMYSSQIKVAKFLTLCEWRNKRSKSSFQELYDALAADHDTHFLCQVGNNCNHRWLFNWIVGYN